MKYIVTIVIIFALIVIIVSFIVSDINWLYAKGGLYNVARFFVIGVSIVIAIIKHQVK